MQELSFTQSRQHILTMIDEELASHIHGLMCGNVCRGAMFSDMEQMKTLLPKNQDPDQTLLEALFELSQLTQNSILTMNLSNPLLLPDDDEKLELRIDALTSWCQGFLIGMDYKRLHTVHTFSAEMQESLDIISSTAIVDSSEVEEDEKGEKDYFEIVEYTRMAVLVIYADIQKLKQQQ